MNRRQMITATLPAAACAAAGFPGHAGAEEGDNEIMQLYRQYLALTDAANAHPFVEEDAEMDALFYNERDVIEDRLMALPCASARDLAIKFLVSHCFGDLSCLYESDPVWNEARELVGGLVRDKSPHMV